MKRLTFLLLLSMLICRTFSFAQQRHFVYIQTENKSPFYVKVNGDLINSSASGYVVIPRLIDSSYTLHIGFPDDDWSLLRFNLTIAQKDAGYLLKKMDGQNWALVNLQSNEMIISGDPGRHPNIQVDSADIFTNMLADVINSPALKEAPVVTDNKNNISAVVDQISNPPVAVDTAIAVALVKENSNVIAAEVNPNADEWGIHLISTNLKGNKRNLIFEDRSEDAIDTIDIIIEYKKLSRHKKPVALAIKDTQAISTDSVSTINVQTAFKPVETVAPLIFINSCRDSASSSDFFRLRKKMAGEKDELMAILMASKAFKKKCYTTRQLGNLVILLFDDANRYIFLETTLPLVFDPSNFSTLEYLLSDISNKTRFRSLLKNNNQ